MSIKRKNKSSQLAIPCLYIKNKFTNCRIPITAITYVEFLGHDLVKFKFGYGDNTVRLELSSETIKLLHDLFPTTIPMK
jgi:hypothetical protein